MKVFIGCLFMWGIISFGFTPSVYAQAPCSIGDRNQGLVSGGSLNGFYGNPTGQCVNGTNGANVAYANFKVPSYSELKSIFFTQNKLGAATLTLDTNSAAPNPRCSNATPSGSITLSSVSISAKTLVNVVCAQAHMNEASGVFSSTSQTVVVFIDGNLYIDSDINYGGDALSGLVLIAKGNISIAASVRKINAILVSDSFIYTSGTSTTTVDNSQQLVINGSLISLGQSSGRKIWFSRSLNPNTQPAEIVNYQPKFLVLLRGLMTQSYTIQREIGPDEIPSANVFPSPVLLPSPAATSNPGSTFQNPYCVYNLFNLSNILNIAAENPNPSPCPINSN